jgi:hypothetical protein
VAVACLLGTAGSARTTPGLEGPLWIGDVSLLGFNLGSQSVYLAQPDGRVVFARDLWTGRPRWRLDIDELPLFTMDAGNGVAAVVTRSLPIRQEVPEDLSVTLVREETGAVLATTTGEPLGTTAGLLLLMRSRPECLARLDVCGEVTAVNLATGSEAWRLSLPRGSYPILSYVDGRVDGFAEVREGEILLRDVTTAAVVDRSAVPANVGGQPLLLGDLLVTADRRPEEVVVTAYRRGPLTRAWSLVVPVGPPTGEFPGFFIPRDCGEVVCLYVNREEYLIDTLTGRLRARTDKQLIARLGSLLLGQPQREELPSRDRSVSVLDSAGRTVATFPDTEVVDWPDSGDRALLAQHGPDRMAFTILDREGRTRALGSVPGTDLACHALGRALACSDPAGHLRLWRLPKSTS